MKNYEIFKEKALRLSIVLLSKTKISAIIEYCKYNEYELDMSKDRIPCISKDGKQMFIQQIGSTLILVDRIKTKDETEDFRENLTELLLFYHMFVHSRSMAIDEDKIEYDINGHAKDFQNIFRIQRFETCPFKQMNL